ncbi:MAG: hypothetical protein HQK77_16290 [Desulfobacterales bacterium]|nr:hypothetical protein [Desulfobacterales bacterium]
MKKAVLFPTLVVTIIFIVCVAATPSTSAQDIWPIGSIIHSLLTESAFQAEMGTEWVLLDGRPINKSDELSAHLDGATDASGNILLPDAQGKFLRMMDYRTKEQRDMDGDPEDNRIVGGYQVDAFASHVHDFSEGNNGRVQCGPDNGTCFSGSGDSRIWDNSNLQTVSSGKEETRPKNIAVNLFIKVRKCQSTQCK